MLSYTLESLDGFPSDVVIAALVSRLGGEVTLGLDPQMESMEGIDTKDLVILLDFEEETMKLYLKDREE